MLKKITHNMELPIISWQWKEEPVSPPFVAVDNEPDNWLFEDDLTHLSSSSSIEEKPFQPTRAEVAAKLLDDLDEWIKEEPFSDWLEEKINLPIFEDLPAVESQATYGHFSRGGSEAEVEFKASPVVHLVPAPLQPMVPHDTQALLQEFESVYGAVEQNNGTLTPPLSPTYQNHGLSLQPTYQAVQEGDGTPLLITTLQQLVPVRLAPKTEQLVPVSTAVVPEPVDVDEFVRNCVEDMETSDAWGLDTSSDDAGLSEPSSVSPPSPCTTSNSSLSSSDESEWTPPSSSGRRRTKPYSRPGQEEKRMRKKEQNKNAATRYRQKKKAEIEVILNEEKGLEDKNAELQQKATDLAREIKYLKGLMRDVFRAKGLIK